MLPPAIQDHMYTSRRRRRRGTAAKSRPFFETQLSVMTHNVLTALKRLALPEK
jgi:hypothetical protein